MGLWSYSALDILLPTIIIIIQECSQALEIYKGLWSLSCGGVPNMLLVLSITFHFHLYIYGVVCVQLAHFSLGDWEDISIAHIIIIIKSEVSTLPIIIFLPWLSAWDACYIIFCHLLRIHSRKTGILFSLLLCSLWWVQIAGYVWLADRVRLFVHYTISLSSLCKLIWRHWTYKMSVRYILSSVWVRLSIFSQLSIVHYMGLCVFSSPISLMMTGKI